MRNYKDIRMEMDDAIEIISKITSLTRNDCEILVFNSMDISDKVVVSGHALKIVSDRFNQII